MSPKPILFIICCVYNARPVAEKSIESLLATVPPRAEVILVDNHSPDPRTRAYLHGLADGRLIGGSQWVATPPRNLGCHGGWNYGFKRCTATQFVAKFDDDTVIKTDGWADKMIGALSSVEDCGVLSADIDAKQANHYDEQTINGHTFEIAHRGIVGFSLVLFRRRDIESWGGMQSTRFLRTGSAEKKLEPASFYGGEEVYLATKARDAKKFIAHYPAVQCHHLDNEGRDPVYVLWKMVHGFYAWTNLDQEDWVKSSAYEFDLFRLAMNEVASPQGNDSRALMALRAMRALPSPRAGDFAKSVLEHAKNESVQAECRELIEDCRRAYA